MAKLMEFVHLTQACLFIVLPSPIHRASIFKFVHIREELLIAVLRHQLLRSRRCPKLMNKLEKMGCGRSVVGLVVPLGYPFNLDGTNIYMTMAALFIAQATNTELTWMQELTHRRGDADSKGASGITGASFIALASTLAVVLSIPIAGMA